MYAAVPRSHSCEWSVPEPESFLIAMLPVLRVLRCAAQNRLSSEDYGKHLISVEDLLQKHALLESDIGVVGERVKSVVETARQFKEPLEEAGGYRPVEPNLIDERIALLESEYKKLQDAAALRKGKLFESRRLWNLMADFADEEQWIRETTQLMSSPDLGHDLTSVQVLLNKHKVCGGPPHLCY